MESSEKLPGSNLIAMEDTFGTTSLVAQMVKASACNAGNPGSIPGSGKSSGEGNGNPLQCSCLENPKDRGVGGLQSTGHKESDMPERLKNKLANVEPWGELGIVSYFHWSL